MTIIDAVHIIYALVCVIFVTYCWSNIIYLKRKITKFHGSVLSDATIKRLLKTGELLITEIDDKDIQPASVDLKISNSFLKIESSKATINGKEEDINQTIYFGKPIQYEAFEVADNEWFTIEPGEFVLATTKSYIKVPDYITSWVEGRSSVGRIGLFTQNAGWIDPGFEGEITLELYNATKSPIKIKPNQVVVQLVFSYLDNKADKPYMGRYQRQRGATGSRQHIKTEGE